MKSDLLELSEPINCDTFADVDNALKYLDNMEKIEIQLLMNVKKFTMKLKILKIHKFLHLLVKKI